MNATGHICGDSASHGPVRDAMLHDWRYQIGNHDLPKSIRAFSSEVDTGSHEENASKCESNAPFRFHRNGALAKPAHGRAGQGSDGGYCFDAPREQ
ncbi:hypothetical protein CVM73_31385 [Bradyrhizobium forestalis]|uniref:Uncharacterized protein n=1 Tax=Bradyrhizobium forestalis TaxID=1419263 RepID=A0A2M8R0N1_9BRAD|nr:hypothetical protein CVM73_31385 [Bradyrhizobium forestalis]